MKFNFNVPLHGLNGDQAKDSDGQETTVGKILGASLANSNKGNAMKMMGWARMLWDCKELHLDNADKKFLTDYIETSEQFTNLTKNALLEILDKKEDL